jgi:maltooligosyltrehalose synthase
MPAIAAIGLGLQVLGMGKSLFDGISQKKKEREANRKAEVAMNQAKSRIEVNRMEGIQVPLDAYDSAIRGNTAQQMQALQGLTEADSRSLAAGVGKLAAAGAGANEGVRQEMEQAIYDRDKMVAGEQSRIDTVLANISLGEAAGYEKEAADREAMASQQISGAVAGAGNAAIDYYKMQDLYKRNESGGFGDSLGFSNAAGSFGGSNVDFSTPKLDIPTYASSVGNVDLISGLGFTNPNPSAPSGFLNPNTALPSGFTNTQ